MIVFKKFLSIFWIVISFAITSLFYRLWYMRDTFLWRKKVLRMTSRKAQKILDVLGFDISIKNPPKDILSKNYFIVCNHFSYLDVLIGFALNPSVFVSSIEVKNTFFLGPIAQLGGAVFINRKKHDKIKEEIENLGKISSQGFHIFVFPEGTSTNGQKVLPFKKSLFRVAFQNKIQVLPICLEYKKINSQPFSPSNRDRVCWYGDMTFGPHFMQLLSCERIEVSCSYLPPIDSSNFSNHGDLALSAFTLISEYYEKKQP